MASVWEISGVFIGRGRGGFKEIFESYLEFRK